MAASSSHRETYLRIVEGRANVDGRFLNVKRLGSRGGDGAFSLVFSATDLVTGDAVVLKFYNPEKLGDTYRLESFRREAEILQRLAGQKDIIRIISPAAEFTEILTSQQGLPLPLALNYYAVEPAGGDVLSCVSNNLWNPAELLAVFRTMCRAVQRIHNERIVHRDLKPDNFLLMRDGAVKLADFGAAALVDGTAPRKLADYSIHPGDTRYSAPEMIALLHDDIPEIAFKADIYSLGAVLFELFTGQNLGLQVFDIAFWDALAQAMAAVNRSKRREVFDQFVDTIVAARPLPSLRDYGGVVPPSIVDRLDALYRALAHLDYRKRLTDFARVFGDINSCLIVLRKEDAYRRWRRLRESRWKLSPGKGVRR